MPAVQVMDAPSRLEASRGTGRRALGATAGHEGPRAVAWSAQRGVGDVAPRGLRGPEPQDGG